MALATVGSVVPGGQAARLARQAQALAAAPMPDARLAVPDAAPPKLVRVHHLQAPPITDPRLVMLNAPESPAAAAYRVLCHRLREHGNPRAILVTSPNRGEGKSICALNLALALVESERAKAVLLETHHQAPSLAQLLGFEPPVGASEQIEAHRERPSQQWEAVETSLPRLHTVAIAPGSTTRPILDGTLNLFVAAFRLAGYDYVVIDGPDALGSADVTLMEESIDGLLMTVRGESTRVRAIRSAVEQVGTKKLLGFALFGSNPA
jgi:Mrp family chromosome partitioning ATPase